MHAENENFGVRVKFQYLLRGIETIQGGHTDIEYGYVGLQFTRLRNGTSSVLNFCDDFPLWLLLNK